MSDLCSQWSNLLSDFGETSETTFKISSNFDFCRDILQNCSPSCRGIGKLDNQNTYIEVWNIWRNTRSFVSKTFMVSNYFFNIFQKFSLSKKLHTTRRSLDENSLFCFWIIKVIFQIVWSITRKSDIWWNYFRKSQTSDLLCWSTFSSTHKSLRCGLSQFKWN